MRKCEYSFLMIPKVVILSPETKKFSMIISHFFGKRSTPIREQENKTPLEGIMVSCDFIFRTISVHSGTPNAENGKESVFHT